MLIQADSFRIPLADHSVHMVATSPPYYAVRDYDGDQEASSLGEIGNEESPEEHIANLVTVLDDAARVLRPDGVLYLNYGDTFAGSGGLNMTSKINTRGGKLNSYGPRKVADVPNGNLLLLPHRIALALQARGWIIRDDTVWWKDDPMPEPGLGWRIETHLIRTGPTSWQQCPGCDQCSEYGGFRPRRASWRRTRAHEYVIQAVRNMGYFSDHEAVRRLLGLDKNPPSVITTKTSSYRGGHPATYPPDLIAPMIAASCPKYTCPECGQGWVPVIERIKHPTRNVEAQRLASTSRTGRGDRKVAGPSGQLDETELLGYLPSCDCFADRRPQIGGMGDRVDRMRGLCAASLAEVPHLPGIVLDPFMGSGTTGLVARELGRRWIGLDISKPYLDLEAKLRTGSGAPSNQLDNLPLFDS
jgi:DNA modification methylase